MMETEALFRFSPCPSCGCGELKTLYPVDTAYAEKVSGVGLHGASIGVCACSECGHQFIQPVPTAAFLKKFYANYMTMASSGFYKERASEEIPQGFRNVYGPRLKRIWALGGKGALLDVGAGTGMFLRLAKEEGFSVAGVEPNGLAAKRLEREFGIKVFDRLIEELEEKALYDAITMWDLLEHLADPLGAIEKARGLLKPGGVLAIEVPVRDSLIHRAAKLAYRLSLGSVRRPLFLIYGVHHLQYFTKASIKKLLEENGFKVIETEVRSTDMESISRKPRSTMLRKAADISYNAALKAAFTAASLAGSANKFVVYARRAG